MTVDIRFCGGCNPRYDRKEFAQRLIGAYPEARFLFNTEEEADAAIVLCGCTAACVPIPERYGSERRLVVTDSNMWGDAVAFIRRACADRPCRAADFPAGKEEMK